MTAIATATGAEAIALAAITYARHGFPIFPLHAIRPDGHCDCEDRECTDVGKHPAAMGWQRSIASEAAVASTWPPDAKRERGIGLATGPRAGLWVLDVDTRHGGDASLADLVYDHDPLPPTWSAITGGGGTHLYWAWPDDDGPAVRNSAGKVGNGGLDVRGQGGYVVLPPSLHASGTRYRWRCGPESGPVVPAPAWLLEAVRAARRGFTTRATPATGEVLVGSGRRHEQLISLCGLMRWWGAGEATIVAAAAAFLNSQCLDDDPANPINRGKALREARDIARRYSPQREW